MLFDIRDQISPDRAISNMAAFLQTDNTKYNGSTVEHLVKTVNAQNKPVLPWYGC